MSELDPNESLSKQFDLIRECDPARYLILKFSRPDLPTRSQVDQ